MRATLSVFRNAKHIHMMRKEQRHSRSKRPKQKKIVDINSNLWENFIDCCVCVDVARYTRPLLCCLAIYCNSIFLFRSANHAIFYLPLELRATRLTSVSRDRYINCCYLSSQKTNWTKTDIVWIWSGSNLRWPGPKILKRKRAQRWHKECPLVV